MKMTKVRLIGLTQVDLPIIGAKLSDPYICKAIDGLGPGEIDVHISENAVRGGTFQGRRAQAREIVTRIGLNPNYILGEAPADLRQALYGLITPDSDDGRVDIQLMDGLNVVAETYGWVKKFETVLFTKEPEVQITFACSRPYLSAPNPVVMTTGLDSSGFEIENPGSAPTGLQIELTMTSAADDFSVSLNNQEFSVGNGSWAGFQSGDQVYIDTDVGNRSVYMERGGVETDLLFVLSGQWLDLRGGINNILFTSDLDVDIDQVSFLPRYWGI
jgi:hypothetical protein